MKRICSTLLAIVLCLSLCTPAFAAKVQTIQVNQLNGWIVIDGVRVYPQLDEKNSRSPITYNSTAYIPLLAAKQWLGADVTYSEEAKTVSITHNGTEPICYTREDMRKMGVVWDDWESLDGGPTQYQSAQLRSDVDITVDGLKKCFTNVQGEDVYPIQIQGCILLPMEVISELSGKQMLEFPHGFADLIHLFAPPEQAEYTEAKVYLATAREHINAVRAMIKGDPPKSEEEFIAKLREAQAHIKAVWTMPAPVFKGVAWLVEELQNHAELVLWEHIDPYLPAEENSGAAPMDSRPKRMIIWDPVKSNDGSTVYHPNTGKTPTFDLEKFWGNFTEETILFAEGNHDYTTYFLDLEEACTAGESFLAKVTPLPFAYTSNFADAKDIQYWDAVATLAELGVVNGRDDGSFDPAGNVTRAEAAKMIAVLMNGGSEINTGAKEEPSFSDIQGHWAEGYIEYCADMNIVSGWDGGFDPEGQVSVVQLYKMALTALGYDPTTYRLTGSLWAENVMERARCADGRALTEGLANDGMDGTGADIPATREVAAQILYNALLAHPIMASPDGRDDDGAVIWKFSTDKNTTLLYQRFALDKMPTVSPQPTV